MTVVDSAALRVIRSDLEAAGGEPDQDRILGIAPTRFVGTPGGAQ